MEGLLYLPFTLRGLLYSCQALPAPLCSMLAVHTGSGFFVSVFLPVGVEHSEEEGVRIWEGRTTRAVFASNQEGAPSGNLLDFDTADWGGGTDGLLSFTAGAHANRCISSD